MSTTFGAAINCMDGRTQRPVNRYVRERFGVAHVDVITEPGIDKILATKSDAYRLTTIKERLMISVEKHGAKGIVVVGHHDCAGNPVDKDTHLAQIRESVAEVKSWVSGLPVVGLWVDENWEVQVVTE